MFDNSEVSINSSLPKLDNNSLNPLQTDWQGLRKQKILSLAGETIIEAWQNHTVPTQALIYAAGSIFNPNFAANVQIAFGEAFDINKAEALGAEILGGNYGVLPDVQFLSNAQMNSALGAYAKSTNTIYINSVFLAQNSDNPTAIGKVLVEEEGHFLDAYASPNDSPGDEGEILAELISGKQLSADQITKIRAEDDTTTIFVDGQRLRVEQSTLIPTITINATDNNAGETLATQVENPGQFTLTRTINTADELRVNYTIAGTAINGTDYKPLTNSVTFKAGDSRAFININPIDDVVFEGNETVLISLATSANYNLGTVSIATVNIADNDKPTITISATNSNAEETLATQVANPGQFTLTRTGNTASALTVNYTVGGTASNGTDYNKLTNSVTFVAGSSTALINITPIDDVALEDTETVIATLATGANYNLGTLNTATVNIADNDTPTITISATDSNAEETLATQVANPGQFTLTRIGNIDSALTVNYTITGTAINGTDYKPITNSVTFEARASRAFININPIDDVVFERNETVVLTLATGKNYKLGTLNTATVNITDDNDKPIISIIATDANAGETLAGELANPGQFTLIRTGDTTSPLTVNYTIAGTAINGTDYNPLTNSVTFAAGFSRALINITPIDDKEFEGNETVVLNLATSTNYNLGTDKTATVIIADNDQPTVTISATDINAGETLAGQPTNPGQFTFSRTGITTQALTVNYRIQGTATNGNDYNTLTSSVVIPVGQSSVTLPINVKDDLSTEGDETVVLSLQANNSYGLGNNSSAIVRIADSNLGGNLKFDGVDDYVSISLDEPETEITHEFRFKTSDPNAGLFAVVDGDLGAGGHDRHIYLTGGNIKARLWNTEEIQSKGLNLADGNWHHVAYTIGASIGGQKLYIDGQLVASGSKTQSDFNWQKKINIGFSNDAVNKYLNGNIDEVRIWNKTLNTDEIRGYMNHELNGNETGLIGYWKLNDATGNIAVDSSSAKRNAELRNNPNLINPNLGLPANPNQWNVSFINRTSNNVADYNSYDFTRPDATVNLGWQNGYVYESRPFETLVVDANKNVAPVGQPKVYSSVLEAGKRYRIEVSGQVFYGLPANNFVADARFASDNSWSTFSDNFLGLHSTALGGDYVWGNYNHNHVYTYEIIGQGQATDFFFVDSDFANNQGTYTIKLYRESATPPADNTIRLNANFGDRSPAANVQSDYFAMQASTTTRLEAGKNYQVTTQSDDGVRFFVKNVATGEVTFIGQEWRDRGTGEPTWTMYFNVAKTADYDFYVQGYERGVFSAFNVELKETNNNIKPNHLGLVTDFDKDGKNDILWRKYSTGENLAWALNGATKIKDLDIEDGTDQAWYFVGTGDFNNDGNLDILMRYHWEQNTGHNVVWLMNGNQHIGSVVLDRVDNNDWHIAGTGDFNQDGNIDILWRNYASGDNHIWIMKGMARETSIILDKQTNLNERIVGTGDFNGDGKIDILWRNAATGKNSIWFMNGINRTSIADIQGISADVNWHIMGTADFNNDGKSDIILRNYATGWNHVWLMNGNTYIGDVDIPDVSDLNWNIIGKSDPVGVWTAQYFGNKDLSGTPTYTEGFTDVNGKFSRNWGLSAPPNTPVDNFSARFKSERYLAAGLYKINLNSDDGVRVWIGNELIIDRWIDQAGNYSDYFTSAGGYYPVTIEYKENGGYAQLNYEIVKYQPYDNFGNPDGIINSWNATFFHWNGQGNPIMDDAHKIGTVNLGGNVRGDGQWGMNLQNWGSGSPAPNVPSDFFAMHAYTRAGLTAGHTYEVWVRSDDGYQVFAHKLGGGAFNITPDALNGVWQGGAYGNPVKWTFVAPESGTFDFKINMFEAGGDAYVDLVLKDVTASPLGGGLQSNPTQANPLKGFRHPLGRANSPLSYNHWDGYGQKYAQDFGGVNIGTPVYAMRSGTVIGFRDSTADKNPGSAIDDGAQGTTANYVLIKLDDGDGVDDNYRSLYLHLQQGSIPTELKKIGVRVDAGQRIGNVGYNGFADGVHLHVEVNQQTGSNFWQRNTVPFQFGDDVQQPIPASSDFTGKVVNTPTLRIRSAPTTASNQVGTLNEGDSLTFDAWTNGGSYSTANGTDNRWYRLKGTENWVGGGYIDSLPSDKIPFIQNSTPTGGAISNPSDTGLRFIGKWEGLRLQMYNDPAGHATIGYGHLVHYDSINGSEPAEFRNGITESRALELLREDANKAAQAVRDFVKVSLTQNQFDALTSFVFNLGVGNFQISDLLTRLNAGDYASVPYELSRWVYAGEQKLEGLVRRRREEGEMFRDGNYNV